MRNIALKVSVVAEKKITLLYILGFNLVNLENFLIASLIAETAFVEAEEKIIGSSVKHR